MSSRVLLSACALALVAASCAQPEPQVLSEAPGSTAATGISTTTSAADAQDRPGRFIARCATEADGGTPGMTVFTDGTQGVTDHCLRRYYIGVQPAPGALYVPDEDAGTYAPSRESVGNGGWTPAQPRTDGGPQERRIENSAPLENETDGSRPSTPESEAPGDLPSGPVTSPGETSPTVVTTTPVPGETTPTSPGDQTTTQQPGEPTTGTGSDEPTGTTTVPTVTETSVPGSSSAPETSVTSTAPSGPLNSAFQVPTAADATR
jgi:hypothetical protein